MLIENTMFGEIDKVKISTDLLKEFEEMALKLHPDGYYLTYSGGKDSDALLETALESGVKFSAHYNVTGLDAPETIVHIKNARRELQERGLSLTMEPPPLLTYGPYKGLPANMWRLIVTKMMPPTRLIRFCCDWLKERGGKDRLCLTGVRWEESASRKNNRKPMEVIGSKRKYTRLFNDNDTGRMQFENCMQKGKRVVNPIIQWTLDDVWELLETRRRKTNCLYCQGFSRIGCIGCPMGGGESMEEEFNRYPLIRARYVKAYDEMVEYRKSRGLLTGDSVWQSGEEVIEWQMWASEKEQQTCIEGQIELIEWMNDREGIEE